VVVNFVEKDIGEMFPKWDNDAKDKAAENIINVMYNRRPWKWTMSCWEPTGTFVNTKQLVSPNKKQIVVVNDDCPRPLKKARKERSEGAPAEASEEVPTEVPTEGRSEVRTTVAGMTKGDLERMFKEIVDGMREGFGTCLREIKFLSERVEAVEKKVGITNKQKEASSQDTPSHLKQTQEPGVSKESSPNKRLTRQRLKYKK